MSLRERTRPGLGIIEPIHEIKHDGMRIMARRYGAGVRLITRNGNDFTSRFPFVVAAVTALPARSFLIDGEAIVTNGDGLAVFDLIRHKRDGQGAVLCAFDLIELDGEDLRRSSIEYRKRKLAKLVRGPHLGIVLNEHYEGDGGDHFQARLQARLRGHCEQMPRLYLSPGTLASLAESQKSECTSSEA
jgi:ATP-dependent DNA ligase